MKRFFPIGVSIFLTLVFGFQCINACDISPEPLRKHFRRSKAVFLAEVKDITLKENLNYNKDLIDGEIIFEIFNSWKGNYKDRTTLKANVGYICGCYGPYEEFKVGQKYIVFVDKKSVANFCASEQIETEKGAEVKKSLDKFWFRSWATIYPF